MKHYVVGIDLGGMSAKGAIFEENGTFKKIRAHLFCGRL